MVILIMEYLFCSSLSSLIANGKLIFIEGSSVGMREDSTSVQWHVRCLLVSRDRVPTRQTVQNNLFPLSICANVYH